MGFASIEELRAARDAALAASDFLMLDDVPRPSAQWSVMVRAYRTELRDLPLRAEAIGLENVELPDGSALFAQSSSLGIGGQEDAEEVALPDELPSGELGEG
jgi:hypothetical protein